VKATTVFVRLRIYLCGLKCTNNCNTWDLGRVTSHMSWGWLEESFGCIMDLEKWRKGNGMFFLNELNVLMGYCANSKRLVNMRELKFNFGCMNAHDYHVIMTHLIPVALRGILPDKVHCPIIKLCSFFNAI
jgi:hypothetical protein